MGPDIAAGGEIREHQQVYTDQIAATIGQLLGLNYHAPHRVAPPAEQLLKGREKPGLRISMAADNQLVHPGN